MNLPRTLTLTWLLLALPALAQAPDQTPQGSVTVDGAARTYRVHVPPGYSPKTAAPLLLLFSNLNEDGSYTALLTGMDATADHDGFIVVYPDPAATGWNLGFPRSSSQPQSRPRSSRGYGRRGAGFPRGGGGYPGGGGGYPSDSGESRPAPAARPDDLAFVDTLLDRLEHTYTVDAARVYVGGMGDGGLMALRLACQRSQQIAAIATVGATLPKELGDICVPMRPVAWLAIIGTKDAMAPYKGGSSPFGYATQSATASAKTWAGLDSCTGKPRTQKTKPQGREIETMTYDDCAQGSAVELLSVDGMGNTWPGSQQYQAEGRFGASSPVPNASDECWRFLSRFAVRDTSH